MTDLMPSDVRTTGAPVRPGWPEIAVAAATFVATFAAIILIMATVPEEREVLAGLLLLGLSALLGLIPFAAACLVRIRDLAAFGLRRTSGRWLAIGAAVGFACFGLNIVVSAVYRAVSGDETNVQEGVQSTAGSSLLVLLAALLLGAVATPIGEELLWRGVLANALGRYGVWVAVPVSSALFAVAHGINHVLPVAFLIGVAAALMFRRTGSIWPAVMVHLVNNALALGIVGLAQLAS